MLLKYLNWSEIQTKLIQCKTDFEVLSLWKENVITILY